MPRALRNDRDALWGEVRRLREMLELVLDEFEDALPYVGERFVRKWGYDKVISSSRRLLKGQGQRFGN